MRSIPAATSTFLVLIFLFGCAGPPQGSPQGPPNEWEVLQNASKSPPPKYYKIPIEAYFKETLFDPFSAKIEYIFGGRPKAGWYGNLGGLLVPRNIQYAWMVRVRVNAKNRFGAYVGWHNYKFFFKGEELVHIIKE